MPPASEIERKLPEWEIMERWRRLPRALMEGLGAMLNSGPSSGRCCYQGTGQSGRRSLAERTSEGFMEADPDEGHCFLPKHDAEDPDQYEFRRHHLTTLDPDYPDAVADIVGAILPRPIVFNLDEMPAGREDAERFLDDVDHNGRNSTAFLASVAEESAGQGISHIFVDADELGQPYWQQYHPQDVPYWETVFVPEMGARVYSEVDVWETPTRKRTYFRGNVAVEPNLGDAERSGPSAARYVRWVQYDRKPKSTEYEETDRGVMLPPNGLAGDPRFSEIPLFPWYTGFVDTYVARPRLRHLAEMCKLKFQKASLYESQNFHTSILLNILEGASLEDFIEANKASAASGGGAVIAIPQGAQFRIEETTGKASEAVAKSIDRLQQRIDHATSTMLHSGSTRGLGGREAVGVAVLKEDRRITRLQVDAAWWQQGVKLPLERAGLYLGANGLEIPFQMPDPDRSRLLAARQGAPERIERLIINGSIPAEDGIAWLIDMGALPEPPETVELATMRARLIE